ncbi:MAG: family 16 glycosylhydrolase [Paludibacteraceae bacterium]|nr:family 16 glycosylhydrolase [Paludibacteraceae bacterium]
MKKTAFLKWLSLGMLLSVAVACGKEDDDDLNNPPAKEEQKPTASDPTPDTKGQLPKLVENQSLRFNLWAENNVGWVGSFNGSNLPITQYIDYVKVSSYDESTKSFKEEWTDEFESFNTTRWSKGNWAIGIVTERTDNIVVEDGVLQLKLTKEMVDGTAKYYGAELLSKESFKYGRYEAKMKMACAPGCISSMFLYYNDSYISGKNWNELDIEVLGKNSNAFQSNIITGISSAKTTTEKIHALPFDVRNDYHIYVMEWTPEYVSWSIDGVEMRRTVAK